MIDVPYQEKLKLIARTMAEFYDYFPTFKCQHATRIVNKVVGLDEVAGRYVPLDDWDAWNYDIERGLYVNLTFGQYDKERPILIVPDTDVTLVEMPDRTKEQRQASDDSFMYIDEIVEAVSLPMNLS